MPVNSVSVIRDTTLLLRDFISGTVADPVGDRQRQSGDAGSNARFVMTGFPQRSIVYPFITLQQVNLSDVNLGMQSEDSLATMRYQIDVWSKQTGQADGLTGSVIFGLRTSQLGDSSMVASGLQDFRIVTVVPRDDPGKAGIHRRMIEIETSFVNT